LGFPSQLNFFNFAAVCEAAESVAQDFSVLRHFVELAEQNLIQ
jgi:hypothetical protein